MIFQSLEFPVPQSNVPFEMFTKNVLFLEVELLFIEEYHAACGLCGPCGTISPRIEGEHFGYK